MTAIDILQPRTQSPPLEAKRLVGVIGLALALAYAVFLFGSYMQGFWLADPHGDPIANDFLGIWSAGRLALDHNPAAAYNWATHGKVEALGAGHKLDSFYPWLYPPQFLFVAMAFALVPVIPASIVWLGLTVPAYVAAIRGILGPRLGIAVACGFPGALWNTTAGQNGFLTAALIGGALGLMRKRPLLAGVCLGLLTYKPQLGLLFPLLLAVGCHWRTMISAAVVAVALAAVSELVFGFGTWQAFVNSLAAMQHLNFSLGGPGWAKWQSMFGLVRWLGGPETLAWTVHATLASIGAVALCTLWASRAPFDLKAAGAAAGVLLATPYVFIYDCVVLAVPVAFLLRYILARGMLMSEVLGLGAVVALLLSYVLFTGPVGLFAALIVVALIAQRVAMWATQNPHRAFRVHSLPRPG